MTVSTDVPTPCRSGAVYWNWRRVAVGCVPSGSRHTAAATVINQRTRNPHHLPCPNRREDGKSGDGTSGEFSCYQQVAHGLA